MAEVPGSVAPIVQAVRERLPGLLDRMAHRIRTEVPVYEHVVDPAEHRTSVRANVEYVLGGLLGDDIRDLAAPMATGRARAAQGVPLVEMLAAYRLGFAEVWHEMVDVARTLPEATDATLVELAGEMFTLHSRYADASVSGYRDEYREIVRTTAREHSALVEAVLAGPTSNGNLWEVAQALRLPMEGHFLVVAAASVEMGHDPLPRIEPALSVLDVSSVWRLQPDQTVGVLALRRTTQTPSVLRTLTQHALARIGVSPTFSELRQASRALHVARLAMEHEPSGRGVEQFRDSPLSMLLASAPDAAIEAARAVFSRLLELRSEDRDRLITTLLTWLAVSGSANAAAETLFCHPNTVRYRLRRIEEITGRSLSEPTQLAEIVTAVRAWSELPHQG
jgi:PucR C-terminal helix-turn-helix domain/GGDEF-like domain